MTRSEKTRTDEGDKKRGEIEVEAVMVVSLESI